jgi:HSP90 family molecular chaperone
MAEMSVAPSMGNIEKIGQVRKEIPVGITARFLEHFSEQLYSSPNKAFEELIANAWDANARSVYVHFPLDPAASDAAIYVLDDGDSMDDNGLEDLWKVAYSRKEGEETTSGGRAMIGKFGIGKLATYVLANQLTYVCKASDGIVRAVTMDYRTIDSGQQGLIRNLN